MVLPLEMSLRFRDCEPGFYSFGRYHGDYLELTVTEVEHRVMDIPNYGKRPMLHLEGSLHHSLLVDNVSIPFVFGTFAMGIIKTVTFNPCGFTCVKLSVRAKRFSTKKYSWHWPIFKSLETGKTWEPKRN